MKNFLEKNKFLIILILILLAILNVFYVFAASIKLENEEKKYGAPINREIMKTNLYIVIAISAILIIFLVSSMFLLMKNKIKLSIVFGVVILLGAIIYFIPRYKLNHVHLFEMNPEYKEAIGTWYYNFYEQVIYKDWKNKIGF